MSSRLIYAFLALASFVSALGCTSVVYKRMARYGWKRPVLVQKPSDLRVYGEYWRVAPDERWSRLPCAGIILGMLLTLCFGMCTLDPHH